MMALLLALLLALTPRLLVSPFSCDPAAADHVEVHFTLTQVTKSDNGGQVDYIINNETHHARFVNFTGDANQYTDVLTPTRPTTYTIDIAQVTYGGITFGAANLPYIVPAVFCNPAARLASSFSPPPADSSAVTYWFIVLGGSIILLAFVLGATAPVGRAK